MAVEVVDPGDEGGAGRRGLRRFVADAVAVPVGPDLMSALLRVMQRDLSAREWVEVPLAWKRLEGFVAAGTLASVADVDRCLAGDPAAQSRPGRVETTRAAADELAAALCVAPRAASTLVCLARRTEATLPATVDALADLRLDMPRLAGGGPGHPGPAGRRAAAGGGEGQTRYRASQVLRRHVWLRDGTCVFPAHHRRAVGTELDHSIPDGPAVDGGRAGPTSDANLGSTCKRGHNARTHGGWRVAHPGRAP